MISTPMAQEYIAALACPQCEGGLILTKEKILFCHPCLLGFKITKNVADLRLASAISFKKQKTEQKQSVNAVFIPLTEKAQSTNESFCISHSTCVFIGRDFSQQNPNISTANHVHSISLTEDIKKLVHKYLPPNKQPASLMALHVQNQEFLGQCKRNPDILLNDSALSKAHTLIYQDDKGVWALDLISKSGTYINGKEIEYSQIHHDDVLSVGQTSLRVRFL